MSTNNLDDLFTRELSQSRPFAFITPVDTRKRNRENLSSDKRFRSKKIVTSDDDDKVEESSEAEILDTFELVSSFEKAKKYRQFDNLIR